MARMVSKGMTRRGRRAFEDAARAYSLASSPDIDAEAKRLRLMNLRVAALVADDPASSLSLLAAGRPQLRADRQQELDVALVDLPRFLLSDAALTLRQRMNTVT
jgi:hypothetical protein